MTDVLHEEIARVAYEFYLKTGREEGRDSINWLDAEKVVFTRRVLFPVLSNDTAFLEYLPMRSPDR
jgi:hypothetical protein